MHSENFDSENFDNTPKIFWVGIGCQRHSSRALIELAIAQACQSHHILETAIAGIATLDRKADEPGLIEYCRDRYLPLRSFTPAQLSQISVPTPSTRTPALVDCPSVAEAAALLAAPPGAKLCVPKQIFRHEDYFGGVTVAIAQS
ncbi:MAG: cobalamin biosynthesis protein [Leptolyngbyaceae cyanobacterium CSU_1_4]|nr:cobalamin biosynthesis protein [Leptolyngbyaceae cyanobacterium CSU_1_4]